MATQKGPRTMHKLLARRSVGADDFLNALRPSVTRFVAEQIFRGLKIVHDLAHRPAAGVDDGEAKFGGGFDGTGEEATGVKK